jgi:hypothetical protein
MTTAKATSNVMGRIKRFSFHVDLRATGPGTPEIKYFFMATSPDHL